MTTIEHLYIHIPFCSGKCSYCTFYSELYNEDMAWKYINGLVRELELQGRKYDGLDPKTIYIGGGTPTVLSDEHLRMLFEALTVFKNVKEFSIEANPGHLSSDRLELFKEYGINRISMGVQSLDDDTLKKLGRRHSVDDVRESLRILNSNNFDNISIDLISGLPGVTEEEWESALEEVISWGVPHVSVYCLSIEEGSEFYKMQNDGRLKANSADYELKMGELSDTMLTKAGYNRYEISNYSRAGFECEHNLAYWRGKDYLGIGASAASRIGLIRMENVSDISAYDSLINGGMTNLFSGYEELSEREDYIERLMFQLRLMEGVEGGAVDSETGKKLDDLIDMGLVIHVDGRYVVREDKRELTNSICEYLLP